MRAISVAVVLAILAVAFDTQVRAQSYTPAARPVRTEVVFVCEHGSVKSLVAMEHFNRKAQARGLPYRAVARGIAPARTVPKAVQTGLHADGFETSGFAPRPLRASDVDRAVVVVSFDQDIIAIVAGRSRHLAWDNLPAVLTDYSRGRNAILARIDVLIDELARGSSP